jgi:hypothetical protein
VVSSTASGLTSNSNTSSGTVTRLFGRSTMPAMRLSTGTVLRMMYACSGVAEVGQVVDGVQTGAAHPDGGVLPVLGAVLVDRVVLEGVVAREVGILVARVERRVVDAGLDRVDLQVDVARRLDGATGGDLPATPREVEVAGDRGHALDEHRDVDARAAARRRRARG